MFPKLFILSAFMTSLLVSGNPKLYAPLGDKLYDAPSRFDAFSRDEALHDTIRSYDIKSRSLRERGQSLDSKENISEDERGEYLSSLRILENDYDYIIHQLQRMLLDSIRHNDYDKFARIITNAPSDVWQSPSVRTEAIRFYQLHKPEGKIAPLEELIRDKTLAQRSETARLPDSDGVYVPKKRLKRSGMQIDQEHIPVGGRGGLEITANQTVAQSFSVARRGRLIALDLVDIKHHRCTPTKSLYVSLVTMENGRLGPYTYYTRELHPNEISPSTRLYFGTYGPMVNPGEQYAIYLKTSAEPGGCTYAWSGDYETYDGGKTFINEMENLRDMKFRSYILAD